MVKKLYKMIFVSLILLSSCEKKDSVVPVLKDSIGAEVDTALVSRGDIYNLTTYDAKIYPDVSEVYFTTDGRLKSIHVYLGQEVKKGDLLISLDDKEKLEELSRLEKELDERIIKNDYENIAQDIDIQIQKLNIERMNRDNASEIEKAQMMAELGKMELLKLQTLEIQQYNVEKIQNKITAIQVEIEKNKIVAPFSGSVVYIKDIKLQEQISAYDPLIILADHSKLHLQSEYIAEGLIKSASQIYAVVNGKEYNIEFIPLERDEIITLNNNEGIIESKYYIQAEGEGIAVGDYGCIYIKDNLKKDVIYIPRNAIYSDSEGDFVYLLIDEKLVRSSVEKGIETDIQVEIKSGLEEGDVIYVQGS
jgi:hypothetical protein